MEAPIFAEVGKKDSTVRETCMAAETGFRDDSLSGIEVEFSEKIRRTGNRIEYLNILLEQGKGHYSAVECLEDVERGLNVVYLFRTMQVIVVDDF